MELKYDNIISRMSLEDKALFMGVNVVLGPVAYNIGTTLLMGGVSMLIFFFVFKIIFPSEE